MTKPKNKAKPKAEKPKKKMGRPRIKVDYAVLENLCKIQCTRNECAGVLGISEDTLDRCMKRDGHGSFAAYFAIHSSTGRASLRRTQHSVAINDKNVQMLIHLGKQYLGQSDKTESSVNMKAEVKEGLDAFYDDIDAGEA